MRRRSASASPNAAPRSATPFRVRRAPAQAGALFHASRRSRTMQRERNAAMAILRVQEGSR
ncbi:hypothetical protein HMPREF0762_01869 [Slackia exigua ATCC 700122]|uniref:Uncharacterized protein n=1 Tax=Slackia exigua (strain ATCC 700122 / DSM 15923 / CIP 105133 / JCM 11022 / KCTC 5966 / S-7) TaxID=649764 RepID=D0WJ44_SLAES|nr:hypothetical protein HMPREF0762_01869 [Slackia exigua ATCC 700122]